MLSKIKFDAYIQEFPALAEVFEKMHRDQRDCDGIAIKRADSYLMGYVPQYDGATGSRVGIDDGERIAFVMADGSVIRDAVRASGYCVHNEAHTDNESWAGETVLDAIYRNGVADTLALIISVRYGYNIRDHYSEPNWSAKVFKPSKGFTYRELVDAAAHMAQAQVKAEAEF